MKKHEFPANNVNKSLLWNTHKKREQNVHMKICWLLIYIFSMYKILRILISILFNV